MIPDDLKKDMLMEEIIKLAGEANNEINEMLLKYSKLILEKEELSKHKNAAILVNSFFFTILSFVGNAVFDFSLMSITKGKKEYFNGMMSNFTFLIRDYFEKNQKLIP